MPVCSPGKLLICIIQTNICRIKVPSQDVLFYFNVYVLLIRLLNVFINLHTALVGLVAGNYCTQGMSTLQAVRQVHCAIQVALGDANVFLDAVVL